MSAKEPREPEDERGELDEEAGEEEVDVLGGGGPAATWQGGEIGEEEAHRADTDHDEL